jgi:D-glycerate 3-kinase
MPSQTQLQHLIQGLPLTSEQWAQLQAETLADRPRSAAFAITPETVEAKLQQRIALLQAAYPAVATACASMLGEPHDYLATLWELWLPLALHLAEHRHQANRPIVQGILGGQGTGKTTLGVVLTLLLSHLGLRTVSLSLDDLYKTNAERQQLQQQDPRLIWRGPPGTHEVELGVQVLGQLRQNASTVAIPRFDKSLHQGQGDRIPPEMVHNIDITLFEGWFVGVHPIPPQHLTHPPPPICTEGDRAFAQRCNIRLQAYLPLWHSLDSLWVLNLPDYRLSKQWRKQAEHQMKASGKPGMSDSEIEQFVEYFWQALHPELFIPPTLQRANLIIDILPNHAPSRVWGNLENVS